VFFTLQERQFLAVFGEDDSLHGRPRLRRHFRVVVVDSLNQIDFVSWEVAELTSLPGCCVVVVIRKEIVSKHLAHLLRAFTVHLIHRLHEFLICSITVSHFRFPKRLGFPRP